LIVRELTQSSNVNSEVFRRNEGRLGQLLPADWADGVEASALATSDRLEAQVSGAKSSMSKEAIRSAYIELAEFLRRRGDSSSALKSLLRSRDYCSTERELAECCLKVVTCGFEVNNLVQVTNHLAKAEAPASQGLLDPSQQASLVAAQGLVFLKKRQYRSAARKFFEVDASLGDSLNEVLSCEDVATYGCLCALAELDRDEVKRRLVDPPSTSSGSSFRHFLDLVPQMRDVAEDVCECRYGKALATLERGLSAEFLMDVHLRDHAAALVTSIRNKCICRYFLPFVSVSLAAMATALGTPLPTLEAQVGKLVMDGHLSARIDSEAKTLSIKTQDSRQEAVRKVEALASVYLGETKAMLLRMSCIEHDLVVRNEGNNQPGGYQEQSSAGFGNQVRALKRDAHPLVPR